MTRYRGGTYSHTVDTVAFADGSTARTDLIRLNPGIEAYSLDFTGIAPTRPSHYHVDTWKAVPNLRARTSEAEVDWILRNSYPTLRAAELSRRLRAAGYLLGAANIAEHEAISGTQAAIWYLTNGLELDNRALNEPTLVTQTPDGMVFEFAGQPELGGYTIDLASTATATLKWQKSNDGVRWRDIAASRHLVTVGGSHRKAFGVGSTLSASGHGGRGRGYRFYRVRIEAADGGAATVSEVRFWLYGSGNYRNAERVVQLYNYLLDGARRARARSVAPRIDATDAVIDAGLVGPLRLQATDSAIVTAPGSSAAITDADATPIDGPIAPGDPFYLRLGDTDNITVTVSVPGHPDGFGGRVLTGVARDEASNRFTPLALAVPTQLIVEFDIAIGGRAAARGRTAELATVTSGR